MKPSISDSVVVKGRLAEGLRESSFFTGLPWVREQFITRLGIDPYPGTLNLDVTEVSDLAKLKKIKKRKGIEITPPGAEYCAARGFPVLIEGKVSGAIIIPDVHGYPESKVEIIAPVKLTEVLSLETGDVVRIEIPSANR